MISNIAGSPFSVAHKRVLALRRFVQVDDLLISYTSPIDEGKNSWRRNSSDYVASLNYPTTKIELIYSQEACIKLEKLYLNKHNLPHERTIIVPERKFFLH